MTVQEAVVVLGVSDATVIRWIRRGLLHEVGAPRRRVGRGGDPITLDAREVRRLARARRIVMGAL